VLKRRLRGSLLRTTIVSFLLLSMAATVAASDSRRLRTDLRGSNEVPPADPDGRGKATVGIDIRDGELCVELSWDNVGTPNRAHIHKEAPGVNGPIVVGFFDLHLAEHRADPLNDQLERRDRFSECVEVEPVLLADIKANPSAYYVNIHNARFPGGMIRGQLGSSGGRGDDDDD
jgi:CHRD domain